jgi:hypothetical protein
VNEDLDIRDLPEDVRRAAGWDLITTGECHVIRRQDGTYEHIPASQIVIVRREGA